MTIKPTNALRRLLAPRFSRGTKTTKPDYRTRLKITSLEDRVTPATFFVKTDLDGGADSLRQAIVDANAAAGADDIQFHADFFALTDGIINLTSGTLAVNTAALTISNPAGASAVTVQRTSGTFGIFSTNQNLTIDGLTIKGGNAGNGGGVNVTAAAAALTVKNSVISGNRGVRGGAINIPNASTGLLTVQDSTISGNTGNSGGIYFFDGGSLLVRNSTISGNTGTSSAYWTGGGIMFYGTIGSDGLTIENSTIHGNTTASNGGGGGINFRTLTGTATIRNSTITGNTAPAGADGGGGVGVSYGSGDPTLNIVSSIIAENVGPANGPDLRLTVGTANSLQSFFGVVPPSRFTAGAGTLSGTAGSPLNPVLRPLANYGGPTKTRVPDVGSPVLNVGSNATGLLTDQRGLAREFPAASPDMGAVERQLSDTAPFASASADDVLVAGGVSHTITVTYEDTDGTLVGINMATVNSDDVRVTGPNGYNEQAFLFAVDNPANGSPRTATYTIAAPVGGWTAADNGIYSVKMQSAQVFDLDGLSVPGGTIASFKVAVPLFLTVTTDADSGTGSLRDAIDQVNASIGDDFIDFDPGFFNTVTPRTISLLTPLAQISETAGGLTIDGPGTSILTVQRDSAAATDFRVIDSAAPLLELSDFTITGGSTLAAGVASFGSASLDRMAITGNTSTGFNGGLYINAGQSVIISNSVISDNVASGGGFAGGIAVGPGGALTLIDSTVSNNTAGGKGGGIFVNDGGTATIIGSTISDNTATGTGGGISVDPFGSLTIQNSTISGNSGSVGGGIYFAYNGSLVMENSTISGNTATTTVDGLGGGGLYFFGTASAMEIRNSTIADNISASSGGGILVTSFAGSLLLQNTTISGNSAANTTAGQGGGGIAHLGGIGTVDLQNTIVSGNTGTDGPDILSPYGSATYSAIGSTYGFTYTNNGGNLVDQTFVLGALADNGGPTKTMAPEAGSLLIDAGFDGFVPLSQTTDQLGSTHERIFGAAVDIGAIEVQPPEVTIEQGATQLDPTTTGPITFDIVFDAAVDVAGFDISDIDFATFSTVGGTLGGTIIPASADPFETHFTLNVTGMAGEGLVIPVVKQGGATDASGEVNDESTSIDNEVTFDNKKPTVTIEKDGAQNDPTNNPTIVFDVTFSEDVTDFTSADVVTSGSASVFFVDVTTVTASTYTVTVHLNPGEGDLTVAIPAGAAVDAVGNLSEAATSSDFTVHFDDVAPTATINQAAGQADPGVGATVRFDVVFSEAVVGFDGSQIDFFGSTATGSFATTVSGTGPAYTVTVSGFTAGGTVVANIPANAIEDTAGNFNTLPATFTDNSVVFINTGTLQFSAPTYTVNENVFAGTTTTLIKVTREGGSEGILTVDYATVVAGSTATDPDDYNGVSGTLTFAAGDTTSQTIVITINDDPVFEPGNETVNLALSNTTLATIPTAGILGEDDTSVLTIDDYEEGTISFSAPTYSAAEGGTAQITVTRTLGKDGAVSIPYTLTFGTASASDIGTVSIPPGVLSWADGIDAPIQINIPINVDALSEGRETVNFGLTGIPTGDALLGTTAAVLTIAPSNPITLNQVTKTTKVTDAQGDIATVKFTSNVGTANVYQTNGAGPISIIETIGTDPLKSTVTVTVAKGKVAALSPNGKVNIGEVVGTGLKAFTATKSDLIGDVGVNLTGYLGSLSVADIPNGADIIFGAGTLRTQKTKLTLGIVGDDTDITATGTGAGGISALAAISFGDGKITAKSADSITIKGRKLTPLLPAVVGNFDADVILSGAAALPNGKFPATLGKLTVAGSVRASADIHVNGDGKATTIKIAGSVESGADISVVGSLKTLTVGTGAKTLADLDVLDGTFSAASVGGITVKGNLLGDITITGAGVLPGKPALGTLKVVGKKVLTNVFGGTVEGSTITVGSNVNVGNITSVTAVNFLNSSLFAGYNDTTDVFKQVNPLDNKSVGTIGTFTVSGATDAFANSHVFASTLKSVKLGSVKTDNGAPGQSPAEQFGFTADVAVTKLTIGRTVFFTSPADDLLGKTDVDFSVKIV